MNRLHTGTIVVCLATAQALAQAPGVQAVSAEQVAALEQSLHAQADATNGTATVDLARYSGYYTQLVYRDRNGVVEIHSQFDEIMIVMAGNATVITGGAAQNVKTTKPGELRGTSILGGTPAEMEKGNLVHIPANTPHQVFVPSGGSVTYIDVKIAHPPS
jgi:mannose-6-phosphate isomerase-like protein (cupin superfamily)